MDGGGADRLKSHVGAVHEGHVRGSSRSADLPGAGRGRGPSPVAASWGYDDTRRIAPAGGSSGPRTLAEGCWGVNGERMGGEGERTAWKYSGVGSP